MARSAPFYFREHCMSRFEAAYEQAQATGYLPEGITEEFRDFWHPQPPLAWLACGDDREPTKASNTYMEREHPRILPPSIAYASTYGGAAGAASTVLLAGTAQEGADFIRQASGFLGTLRQVQRMDITDDDTRLVPVLHTAESNEPGELFCAHGTKPVGCAYCALKGPITASLVETEIVTRTAQADQRHVFGDDAYDDALFGAAEALRDHERQLAGPDAPFSVDRTIYTSYGQEEGWETPTMVVAGEHAKRAPYIASFLLRKIGSAASMAAAGRPAYRTDVAPLTSAISRKFDLNPALVARAVILEATGVRGGLVAHSAPSGEHAVPDPRRIPMGVLGNAQAAIDEIQQSMRRNY